MVFGPIIITGGLADGTFVEVSKKSKAFDLKVGADGSGVRSKSNDNSAEIKFTILQSCDANDLLSAQHALDLATSLGDGIAPLIIKDNTGNTLVLAGHAWITKFADVQFSREATLREWTLETDNIDVLVGGNAAI